MIVVNTDAITLRSVKRSKYWDLISILVWSHYSEAKFQDPKMIKIKEVWYGKTSSGGSYSRNWDEPDYKADGCERTLSGIEIEFTRSDYTTHIRIDRETGAVHSFGLYNNQEAKQVNFSNGNSLTVANWMLDHNFFKVQ